MTLQLRRLADAGLGLRVGAVLQAARAVLVVLALAATPSVGGAQVVVDTVTKRDTIAVPAAPPANPVVDSLNREAERIAADTIREDTLKAPLATHPSPPAPLLGTDLRWNRDEMFATGAVTLLDLLERVPGVTGMRSGWLTTPMVGSWAGDPSAIRLYLDGIELDRMDPRGAGVHDLSRVPLWSLEEVVLEPSPEELRIHLTTWRVSSTVPHTRTDVFTGDDDTNIYRGFFGRRFVHGEALQLGAQQYSTSGQRLGGDGDGLDLLARIGLARGRFSTDAFVQRSRRGYDERSRTVVGLASLAPYETRETQAYVRAGFSDVATGLWLQLVAASLAFEETGDHRSTAGPNGMPIDTVDTTSSRAQYVASAGWSRGGLRLTGTHRLRVFGGERYQSPSIRASLERPWLTLSLFGEANALDDLVFSRTPSGAPEGDAPTVSRASIVARLQPLPFVQLLGSAGTARWSRATGDEAEGGEEREETRSYRAEAGVRLARLWVGAGAMRTDSGAVAPPVILDPAFRPAEGGRIRVPMSTAGFLMLRGPVFGAIGVDAWAMRWEHDSLPYRPQVQTRATLYLQTRWLSRFPSGSFGIYFGATHEYRTETWFPIGTALVPSQQTRLLSTLLEIRILDGVLSWQQRNWLGAIFEPVPGFQAPRQTNLYGVRWEFFN